MRFVLTIAFIGLFFNSYSQCADIYPPTNPGPSRIGPGSVTFNVSLNGTGGNTVRWYTASSGGTFFRTGTTYTVTLSTTTTYYITAYNSTTKCESLRAPITATITTSPPVISKPADQMLTGCGPGKYTVVTAPGTGGNQVKWYNTLTGGTPFHVGNSYTFTVNAGTTQYYIASSDGTYESVRAVILFDISPQLNPGNIVGNQTICANTSVGTINNSQSASGGVGIYSYQWQTSTDGSNWSNISGATGESYTLGALSVTHYFRRSVTSTGCGSSVFSNTIAIIVHSSLYGGIVFGDQMVCSGGSVTIEADDPVEGGDGNYSYQWERSVNGVFESISGATGLSYTTTNITQDTQFRRRVTSGTCVSYSNTHAISILLPLNPGSISGTQTICYNTIPASLSSIQDAGGGIVSYEWQVKSIDSNTWNLISGTGAGLVPDKLRVTSDFRRVAVSQCGQRTYTDPITITVRPDVNPGSVSGLTAVCTGSNVYLSSSQPTGGDNVYSYQWQRSEDGNYWNDIPEATTPDFSPVVSSSMYFKRIVYSCMTTKGGNAHYIHVDQIPTPGQMSDGGEFFGSASGVISLTNYVGTVSKWIKKTSSNNFTDITTTDPSLPFSNVSETTDFWAVISGGTCGTINSSLSKVTVYPLPEIVVNGTATLSPGGQLRLLSNNSYYAYQWFKDNTAIGTNNSSFTIDKPGNYSLEVRGSATSPTARSSVKRIKSFEEPEGLNYIRETNFTRAGIATSSNLYDLNVDDYNLITEYYDGIGKSLQTVALGASPAHFDIVTMSGYDKYWRKTISYLPYARSERNGRYVESGIAKQASFYTSASDVAHDNNPFSITVLEQSPLGRLYKQGAPGEVWQPNENDQIGLNDQTIKYKYTVNENSDQILVWRYNSTTHLPENGTTTRELYPANFLFVLRTFDEHNNEVIEYKNKFDQVVLKKVYVSSEQYASTYYVYTKRGQLAIVIPPEAVAKLDDEYFTIGADKESFLRRWSFRYKYDDRMRMIEKQIPGADPVYLIYDNRDRLVLTQDGNQRTGKNEWTFTKYDALNRPILTGIVDMGNKTVENLRDEVKDPGTYVETRGSAVHGYTNNAYPNVADESKYLTVTYYDDYDFLSSWTGYNYTDENLSATPHGVLYEQPDNHFPFVKGQVTGGKTKVLDGLNTWLKSVNYYDDKYRLAQTIADNHLGGTDKLTNLYDFVGKVLKTRTRHNSQLVDRRFEYDHAGRLLETWHSINGADDILLAKNEYNELGQLVTKKLHGTLPSGAFKQSVDYRYNIRGWLEKINDVAAPEPDDFFSMELKYNNPSPHGGTAQYNGNISEIVWKGAGVDEQSYGFYYDPMNRLTDANYFNATTPGTNGRFNEKIGTPNGNSPRYDLNGNILSLTRNGKKDGSPLPYGPMDQLTYTYTGNQVTRIDDAIEKNLSEQGFKEEVKADNEYTYDANGNMTKDANKGITSITYNHLNLPVKVSKSETEYIEYTYDATGRKLRQQVFGTTPRTTDYQGEFVYENNELQFINHEEGRVVMTGSTPEYQYHLKDHLGNVRLTFTSKEEVEESIATMEDANAEEEETNYLYYNEAIKVNHPLFDRTDDHTPGGATHNATRLTGGNTNAVYGLARSLSVMPGDKINMEVWAKYLQLDPNKANWNASVKDFLTQYAEGSSAGVIDGGAAGSIGNTVFPYAGLLARPQINEQAPKAFITWLVFDRDYNPLIEESGYMQIGIEAKETGSNIPHQRLYRTAPLEIKQAGFVYIYLSNENETPVEVFFDDFKVVHIKSPVIQTQDYYPFGLAFNSYSRENSTPNQYKFNGIEEQDELGLGIYAAEFRNYDPAIGRWWSIDPKPDERMSPYAAMSNNPILYSDPLGDTIRVNGSDEFKQQYQKDRAEIEKTDAGKELFKFLDEHTNDVNVSEAYSVIGAIMNLFSEGSGDEDHVLSSNTEEKPGGPNGTLNADVEYSQINGVQVDDQKSQSHTTLVHELSHAKDIIDGTYVNDARQMPVGEAKRKSEERAMNRTNQVSFELGQPQRLIYGGGSRSPITVQPVTKKEKLRN